MKWAILTNVMTLLIKRIDAEDIEMFLATAWDHIEPVIDSFLDKIEDKYFDNAFVIHACNLVRQVMDIEDDDDLDQIEFTPEA